ncbi:hypothetical protein N7445_010294 [Penicillium cf. griseofulvum]|nr:hypothetical protein N7445_010294 [Penicillium cf. griseofulvum]
MGDALRPGVDEFSQVLQGSLMTWTSYLATENKEHLLPRQAINMRPLVSQTPPFLVGSRLHVELSEDSPLSDWPGVQGLSGYDKGNYLSVLYFAWAYIISARWVELLGRSADHECHMGYTSDGMEGPLPQPDNQPMAEIVIGDDACEEEVLWWRAILCSNDGWDATAKYNGHVYLSPWSISSKKRRFTLATKDFLGTKSEAPLSGVALNYLSRFCVYHWLYAQCSVALAGVLYIPFLRGRTVSLPPLRQASRLEPIQCIGGSPVSIPDLFIEYNELLPKYMTLSSNTWGMRSLLYSTFFNPAIECNLVSAWLNPAFAIIDFISPRKNELATFWQIESLYSGPSGWVQFSQIWQGLSCAIYERE